MYARFSGKTITSVLEPIFPGDESVDELKEKVRDLMQEEFFRLQDELAGRNKPVITSLNGKITTKHD